ncbi:DUF3152 domain-containing protein [Streptomyces sp. NPDC048436]|uniref:DUF3152 domain-containing protein n=1 Tax=Streptomyces sp. NPDC048436 TaxID=3365550 RepID=UPI003721A0CB
MGRHSRRGSADLADNKGSTDTAGTPAPQQGARPPGPGTGRRRRAPGDGTPAHGVPQATPPHGFPQATPAQGTPRVRGGHPEQREPGGAWGAGPRMGAAYGVPGARTAQPGVPGPRREYVDAFGGEFTDEDLFAGGAGGEAGAGTATGAAPHTAVGVPPLPPPPDPYASVTDWDRAVDEDEEAHGALWSTEGADGPDGPGDAESAADSDAKDGKDGKAGKGGGKGRAFTGIAAAAVTTVLAIVVAGQMTGGGKDSAPEAKSAKAAKGQEGRDPGDPASRSDDRPTPPESAPATYETKMAKKYPLDAKLTASGDFDAMAGFDKAPGKGQVFRYRVDVEKGMGLDGELFASAVQKTLNDNRSWAHGGGRTFERISSGKPDFVITLASPGTTAKWCAKSGLDTLQQNVSCDSAATDRVMINAYRWAQGAKTYGDRIHPYRQMLINHEVGHRLGFNHTDCTKDGELAPVMQQQTKFLNHDGIKCKANAWAFPKS